MFMSPNPIARGIALMWLCNVKMLHELLVSVSASPIWSSIWIRKQEHIWDDTVIEVKTNREFA